MYSLSYELFGTIGPLLELGALLATAMLALRLRGRPAVRATSFSVGAIVLSLLVWATFVLPANMHINQWPATGTLPLDWTRWRAQWQVAQAATFVLHLFGFSVLLRSIIRDTAAE